MSSENNNEPQVNSPLAPILRTVGRSLIFRGVLEITVGILLLAAPVQTIKIFTIVIGAALILSGLLQLLTAAGSKNSKKNWALINAAVLLVVGVLVVCFPLKAEKIWIILLGLWLVVSAINELGSGGARRISGILSCVLSLLIGVFFIVYPFTGLAYIVWIVGIVMIVSGVLTLGAGMDMNAAGRKL